MSLFERAHHPGSDSTAPAASPAGDTLVAASRLVAFAFLELKGPEREAVVVARRTLAAREHHVGRSRLLAARARDAHADFISAETQDRDRITRPPWLTPGVDQGTKLVLVVVEVVSGAAVLGLAGEPLAPSLVGFVGLAVAAVAAGNQVGCQLRRREQGQFGARLELAGVVVLAASLLGLSRHSARASLLAILALVATLAATAAAALGFAWHDPVADRVGHARERHRGLARRARAELDHRSVRRFDAAHAVLWAGASAAVQAAQVRLSGSEPGGPDPDLVTELLVAVVGPGMRNLTPREAIEDLSEGSGRRCRAAGGRNS